MGASKGVLLSGIALIIGMYSVGIKKADAIIASSASTRVYQLQSDANARSALRIAVVDMIDNSWSTRSQTVIFLGDTLMYDIDNLSSTSPRKAKVTCRSRFKGVETKIVAYVQEGTAIVNRRGRRVGSNWTITKSYLVPSTESFITN